MAYRRFMTAAPAQKNETATQMSMESNGSVCFLVVSPFVA